MTRRSTQLIVLFFVTVLMVAAVWYQMKYQGVLQTQVLSPYGGYGYTPPSSPPPSQPPPPPPAQTLEENIPELKKTEAGLDILTYFVTFDELTVLDGLQVSFEVPSLSTPVRWVAESSNYQVVAIDDVNATRTAFITPKTEGELIFYLEVKDTFGNFSRIAKYIFFVMSPLAMQADVNKDGKFDFRNDLVHLLRNWDSFGGDATRILALILSRIEPEDAGSQ